MIAPLSKEMEHSGSFPGKGSNSSFIQENQVIESVLRSLGLKEISYTFQKNGSRDIIEGNPAPAAFAAANGPRHFPNNTKFH